MVDKLALVSKVLLDQRFLELKQENEQLKLQLFWKEYNRKALKKAMIRANLLGGYFCMCGGCCENMGPRPCTFKPWFEETVRACGLTFGPNDDDERDNEFDAILGMDYHLINIKSNRWGTPIYGAKLAKAKSVLDLELQKLAALFKALASANILEY
jgi:hypothetical protein